MRLHYHKCETCSATEPDHIIYCVIHDQGEGIRPRNEHICRECFDKRLKGEAN